MTSSGPECGIKCFSERKTCCRDLQRWSRNLLYMIGLEDVAKEFTDPKSWQQISPFLHTEKETQNITKDWCATEKCPVCCGKRCAGLDEGETHTSLPELQRSSSSNGLDTPVVAETGNATPRLNFDFLFGNVSTSDQSTKATQYSSTFPQMFPQTSNPFQNFFGFQNQPYLNQLLHWSTAFNPSLYNTGYPSFMDQVLAFQRQASALQQHLSLPQSATGSGLDLTKDSPISTEKRSKTATDTVRDRGKNERDRKIRDMKDKGEAKVHKCSVKICDQPLDLSIKPEGKRKSTSNESNKVASNGKSASATSVDASPSQSSLNGKRSYSQVDLEAAVKDIRSGRLGTRRASVVYGIPRSTLRNKIYKLEAAEENGAGTAAVVKKVKRTGVAISTSPLTADICYTKGAETPPSRPSSDTRDTSRPESSNLIIKEEINEPTSVVDWSGYGADNIEQQRRMMEQLCKQPNSNPYMQMNADAWSQFQKMWTAQMQCSSSGQDMASSSRVQEKTPSIPRRISTADSVKSQDDNGEDNAWNKKTRPKRGQYRKYDKNALHEAVQSVRRGEMSVHRAGSYYGVPHSTLEYKVKERNLMRRPSKRGTKVEDKNGEPSESGSSPERRCKSEMDNKSEKNNSENQEASGSDVAKCLQVSSACSATSLSPLGSPLDSKGQSPIPESINMSKKSSGFSNASNSIQPMFNLTGCSWPNYPPSTASFFASEMMRRLQVEADSNQRPS